MNINNNDKRTANKYTLVDKAYPPNNSNSDTLKLNVSPSEQWIAQGQLAVLTTF